MLVSIIIPTYKSWDLLAKCLSALESQTFEGDFEVLVVNNDINNDIPDNLQKFKNVKFLQEVKPGSYAARNKGLEVAAGEIIAFTDADCIPDKDWLQKGVERLITSKAGIVAGDVKLFYKDAKKLTPGEVYDKYTGFDQEGYVKYGHCVTANWFSRKEVLQEFGNFNNLLKSNGDSELSGKISEKYPVVFEPKSVVYHPARYFISEIITKHNRLIGGTYDRKFRSDSRGFNRYVWNFIFRRFKFNANLFRKGKVKDGVMIFIAHTKLFPAILKESRRIEKGGATERL